MAVGDFAYYWNCYCRASYYWIVFLGEGFIPIAIIGLLVWGLIAVLSKKDEASRSVYKQKETLPNMKIQYLFYIVGVIFVFAAVWYFAHEYIAQFPNIIKLILLIVAIVISYVIAEFMRGSDI